MTRSINNKRIAKNTILLYLRMIVILLITLYTSRVVLSVLGADNFGIYNIVGGVVVLFSFLTNALTASTQRFLNYNLGLGDKEKIKDVFNTSVLAHFCISVIILVLAETIGLWFVETQLNIPQNRSSAAFWVYQTSLLTTIINVMVIPYRASIIATEKMSIFAYLSIIETVLKLVIVIYLPFASSDTLILYSFLIAIISLVNYILYRQICHKKISFTYYHFLFNKKQMKEQLSFSGWYLFGGVSTISARQGTNILINIFFNVGVNAAVGIANQVRNAIFGFITSFQTAFNPQIVKLYASGEFNQLEKLIYRSSKFSFFLLFVFSFPIILYCEEILSIWLIEVPKYATIFTKIILISSFAEALSAPLWTAIGATGKVKHYQFYVSLIILFNLPLIFIAFKLGLNPTYAFYVNLVVDIIAFIYRFIYIQKYVCYKTIDYIKNVVLPCFSVLIITIPISYYLKNFSSSFHMMIIIILLTEILICISIFYLGLHKDEKNFLIKSLLTKIRNK